MGTKGMLMNISKFFAIMMMCGAGVGTVLFGVAYYFRESFIVVGDVGFSEAMAWSVLILALPALVIGWGLSFVLPDLTESSDWKLWVGIVLFGLSVAGTSLFLEYQFLPLSFKGLLPTTILAGLTAPFPLAFRAWMEE